MDSMDPELPVVKLSLWRAEAIVLFDWVISTDLNTVPITHPAQKQALADLLSRLEFDTGTDITPRPPRRSPRRRRSPKTWAGSRRPAVSCRTNLDPEATLGIVAVGHTSTTMRSLRQIPVTVRATAPSALALAMAAVSVSRVNQATRRSFSIAAWARGSVRCDLLVPNGRR
jgi:hypothetical protein